MISDILIMIIIISNVIFNVTNFCIIVIFIDLISNIRYFIFNSSISSSNSYVNILGILSLTSFILEFRAAVAAKLVMLGISPLTSFILAVRVLALVDKLVIIRHHVHLFQ